MTDDLFPIPEQPLDPLAEAGRRFAAAGHELALFQREEAETGEPVPHSVKDEYCQARYALEQAELAELERQRAKP